MKKLIMAAVMLVGAITTTAIVGTAHTPASAAPQTVTITLDAPERVIFAAEGSETRIRSEAVAQYAGYTCGTSFTSTSESVHPGNNILVRSGTSSTTFENIERAPGTLNLDGEQITLSNNVHSSLIMGPDGAYSAAYTVTLTCIEPTTEICVDGKVVTVGLSEVTSSSMPAPCPEPEIEVCRDGEPTTIKENERRDTDTELPCPVEEITVCVDGETVTIPATDYNPEIHTEGECQVTVCRDGVQVTVVESIVESTDTEAPCESNRIVVCRDGIKTVIDEDDRKSSDTNLLSNGDCTEVKSTVVELPKTGASALLSATALTAVGGAVAHNVVLRRRK